MLTAANPSMSLCQNFGSFVHRYSVWPLVVWVFFGVMLFSRAVTGHFRGAHLSSKLLLTLAVVLPLLSCAIRWIRLAGQRSSHSIEFGLFNRLTALFLPSFSLILCGVALTIPRGSVTGLVFLWIAIAFEIVFGAAAPWTRPFFAKTFRRSLRPATVPDLQEPDSVSHSSQAAEDATMRDESSSITDPGRRSNSADESETIAESEIDDQDVGSQDIESEEESDLCWLWRDPTARQEQRRSTIAGQGEAISGAVRVTLAADQGIAFTHVAFCPPLLGKIQVEVEMIKPENARVTAAQVQPNGIRWDVKLPLNGEQINLPRIVTWSYVAIEVKTK